MSLLRHVNTQIYWAVCAKDLFRVKLLHKLGADINAYNGYLIIEASFIGSLEICKYLTSHPNYIPDYNNDAFIWAIKFKHIEICKLFLELGCEKNKVLDQIKSNYTDSAYQMYKEFLDTI